MKSRFFLTLAAACAFVHSATSAKAAVAYLSNTGSGSACTLSAPCGDIGSALAAAGPFAAQVICLNKGAYLSFGGTATISASVTISCGDGLWAPQFGVLVVNTPPNSKVIIEGYFADEGDSGFNAISFIGQGTLELLHVRASGSTNSNAGLIVQPNGPANVVVSDSAFLNNAGSGILVQPTNKSRAAVVIRNTIVSGNASGGIFVTPNSGSTAIVELDNVNVTGNSFGLGAADGSVVSVRNSAFANNVSYGVIAYNTTGPGAVDLTNSTILGTASYGVLTAGSASVSLSQMRIYGNGVGVFASGGSTILSFGNNAINGNTADGAPTGSVALK